MGSARRGPLKGFVVLGLLLSASSSWASPPRGVGCEVPKLRERLNQVDLQLRVLSAHAAYRATEAAELEAERVSLLERGVFPIQAGATVAVVMGALVDPLYLVPAVLPHNRLNAWLYRIPGDLEEATRIAGDDRDDSYGRIERLLALRLRLLRECRSRMAVAQGASAKVSGQLLKKTPAAARSGSGIATVTGSFKARD